MPRIKFYIYSTILLGSLASRVGYAQQSKNSLSKAVPVYKDKSATAQIRAQDLLAQMTLEEKVAQTLSYWLLKKKFILPSRKLDPATVKIFLGGGIGHICRPSESVGSINFSPGQTVALCNQIQAYLIKNTRLGIPAIFHEESLHGQQASSATNFPTPLAIACSWDTALAGEMYRYIATEVRSRGAHQVLAPVVDLARDPRWGRTEETYGEDSYLASRFGVAAVRGYQGNGSTDLATQSHVISTLKHFPVHGTPEGGVNIAPAFIDERTVREVNLAPFKACVQEAHVLGVMPCYNELGGIPAHANRHYIQDILKGEFGFKGAVVSDYMAIAELKTFHKIAIDSAETARRAMEAGVDVELPDAASYPFLTKLVRDGKVPQAQLDSAVIRILRLKFQLGLFENPFSDSAKANAVAGSATGRALARKAAGASIVLLKNDGLLPLQPGKYKKIAIIGPNADRCILGGYSDKPRQAVSPLAAFKELGVVGSQIVYAEGVRITDQGNWFEDPVILSSRASNLARIAEAKRVASDADLVILVLGSNEAISREAWSLTHMGDRTNLDMPNMQDELVDSLAKLGKPMAAFVTSGPPVLLGHLATKVSALANCFFLGQETGYGIYDVATGKVNPSGKLSISIPRSVGHLPVYYAYKPSGRRGYQFDSIQAQYPFGYGLSYTRFAITAPSMDRVAIEMNQKATVSVEVTNQGAVAGAEVVQLYIRDQVSSLTRPVRELKSFVKVFLQPGEKKTVSFSIGQDQLAFYNEQMKFVVEPGDFDIYVGNSSTTQQKTTLTVR